MVRVFLIHDNDIRRRSPLHFVSSWCRTDNTVGLAFALKPKHNIHFCWCIWKHPCRLNNAKPNNGL